MTEDKLNKSTDTTALSEVDKRAKRLKKDRILLVVYVITVLIVAYFLDSKITEIKGQQYYDRQGTTDSTKP